MSMSKVGGILRSLFLKKFDWICWQAFTAISLWDSAKLYQSEVLIEVSNTLSFIRKLDKDFDSGFLINTVWCSQIASACPSSLLGLCYVQWWGEIPENNRVRWKRRWRHRCYNLFQSASWDWVRAWSKHGLGINCQEMLRCPDSSPQTPFLVSPPRKSSTNMIQ